MPKKTFREDLSRETNPALQFISQPVSAAEPMHTEAPPASRSD